MKLPTAAIKRLTNLLTLGLESAIHGIVENDRKHTRVKLHEEERSRTAAERKYGPLSLQQKLTEDFWP